MSPVIRYVDKTESDKKSISLLWCRALPSRFSHVRLCDPIDCSPPGSSVHGILQARIQEWVAISFSRGSSQPSDQTCVSYVSCFGRQVFFFTLVLPVKHFENHCGFLPKRSSSLLPSSLLRRKTSDNTKLRKYKITDH